MKNKSSNIKLSASIMCADLSNLEVECLRLEVAKVDRIHFDIMDGLFVNNIELGFSLIRALREISDLAFECHLMVLKPERYIDVLLELGIEYICVQIESVKKLKSISEKIRNGKSKIGIAINPDTSIDKIKPFLGDIDQVCFMTVLPGFAGQPFRPDVLRKIKELKNIIRIEKYNVEIETDGNMNKKTIPEVVRSGADVLVLGSSSLFAIKQNPKKYKTIVNEIRDCIDI